MTETPLVRAFDVRVNSFGDSTILVRGQDVYELGDVEHLIWTLCDGTRSVAEIADAVVEQFDVDRQTATDDVREFLTELHRGRLVEPVGP
jgi:pyrroloquinoline quinone biosynthesis protein D